MSEYIEKKEAIKFIDNCLLHEDKLQCVEKETLLAAKKQIEAIPAADVRPVVRGRWEWRHRHRGGFRRVTGEDDFGIRHTITVDERYAIDDPYCPFCGKLNESVFLNFCPNCGADMSEDKS